MTSHHYELAVQWTGNKGEGTKNYKAYERSYLIISEGKPTLFGSSDPKFRGDVSKWNPEELLVAALSSCHMLWYLHLCADHRIVVKEYLDQAKGVMEVEPSGSGRFTEVILYPKISITDSKQLEEAATLHQEAHKKCFIANSVNFPIKINPSIYL